MAQAHKKQHLPLGRQNLERGQLTLPPENPKDPIDLEKLESLKASIREDPSMLLPRPIGVADGPVHHLGGYVWGGNQRVLALEELYADGWTPPDGDNGWPAGTYPCVVQDIDLKTAQERLSRDNQQWADWNPRAAVKLLKELQAKGSNLGSLGWDPNRMSDLMRRAENLQATLAPATTNGTPQPGDAAPPPPSDSPPDGEDGPDTEFLDEDAASGDPDLRFPQEAQPPQLGDDLHEFVLRITVEQRDCIMGAVHSQRRLEPDQTTAEALASVCEFWTAEHAPQPQEAHA